MWFPFGCTGFHLESFLTDFQPWLCEFVSPDQTENVRAGESSGSYWKQEHPLGAVLPGGREWSWSEINSELSWGPGQWEPCCIHCLGLRELQGALMFLKDVEQTDLVTGRSKALSWFHLRFGKLVGFNPCDPGMPIGCERKSGPLEMPCTTKTTFLRKTVLNWFSNPDFVCWILTRCETPSNYSECSFVVFKNLILHVCNPIT